MQYKVTVKGDSPIIMHDGTKGLNTRSAENREKAEIAKKKGTNRTVVDDERLAFLDCKTSLWLDETRAPTIIPTAFRACIEAAARKLKQGPLVRGGLMVLGTDEFEYDTDKYGATEDEIATKAQFTVPVKVQQSRILRTRAKFDEWTCIFTVWANPELIDEAQLSNWLSIAGMQIGVGDWRPEKSGHYGRFSVVSIEPQD